MKHIKILSILPVIYSNEIEPFFKDRVALAKQLEEETAGLIHLEARTVEGGGVSIESSYDAAIVAPYVLKMAQKGQDEGFDAIVLDCFGDPAMDECRELLDIPIFGAGQSACLLAMRLGCNFSIISTLDSADRQVKGNLMKYGIRDFLVSMPVVNTPVTELNKDPQKLTQEIVTIGYKAVKEDKANVLIFGCTGMSPMVKLVTDGLKEKGVSIPVIEPYRAALFDAVSCVMIGVQHSKTAYMSVRDKVRKVDW